MPQKAEEIPIKGNMVHTAEVNSTEAMVNCPTPCRIAPAALTPKDEKHRHRFKSAMPQTDNTVPQSPNSTPDNRPKNRELNNTRKIPNSNAEGNEY